MYTASQLLNNINNYIANLDFVRQPKELYVPIEYTMSLGGKRIRPLFLVMAYNLYKENIQDAFSAAAGIELFHNYTLLHDDLMDRSEIRRGKSTVYKIWGDNTAILSGDAMTALAFSYMTNVPQECLKDVLAVFSTTSLEVCEGQQYDMDFEKRADVSESDYLEMIRLKTSVLLAASFKIGAIIGGANQTDSDLLYLFGEKIGIAFQLQDDLLDVYGNPDIFGKKNGGDILCNKKTFMFIKALELANPSQKANLQEWILATNYDANEKIAAVTELYNQMNIREVCEMKIHEYYISAFDCLDGVKVSAAKKQELKTVIEQLMNRNA